VRSWIGAISALAGTVMTAKVRSHVSVEGLRQFSQTTGTPNGPPSRLEIANASRSNFSEKAVHRHDAAARHYVAENIQNANRPEGATAVLHFLIVFGSLPAAAFSLSPARARFVADNINLSRRVRTRAFVCRADVEATHNAIEYGGGRSRCY
jgi:hypothetical protein